MRTSYPYNELVIVGFSSVIEENTLPRILAPIFQVVGTEWILFPPLRLGDTEVDGFNRGNISEFETWVVERKITKLLDDPIEARPYCNLWVSPEGVVAYSLTRTIRKHFAELFDTHIILAKEKLRLREYETACRHAAIARSVDTRKLEPLLVRGAAERAMENDSQYELTRHIATDIVNVDLFDRLTQENSPPLFWSK